MDVAQVLIPVADLDRAVAFYRDTVGLPFLFAAPPKMSFFQAGPVRLLVAVSEDPSATSRVPLLYLKVPDIHATHRALVERGVVFGVAPHVVHRTPAMELWLAEFHDPDGNGLALMGEAPPRPAE